jgi:hypothetical protein
VKSDKLLTYAAIGVGAYLLYQYFTTGSFLPPAGSQATAAEEQAAGAASVNLGN